MADDHPQPDEIHGYLLGSNAKIEYLFRKTLSNSDMRTGLLFIRDGPAYLYNRGPEMIALFEKGLELKLHTPNNIGLVKLKHYTTKRGPFFQLLINGWREIARQSGFDAGKIIDCWALSSEEFPLELLIQLAPPEQQPPDSRRN